MRQWNVKILAAVLCCICGSALRAQEPAAAGVNSAVATPAGGSRHPDASDSRAIEHRDARYRLGSSDVIALSFPLTPEFNQTVSIQPDGFASLAGAANVHLEGLTTQESADAIRAAYAEILHDPIVTVELKEYIKPYFIVTGQVNRPGKYDLHGNTSATEAIAIAGGFTGAARHSQVLLFRRVNTGWYEVRHVNLKKIFQGRDITEDPAIRPGDMLFVPQSTVSKMKRFIPSSGLGAYYQLHP